MFLFHLILLYACCFALEMASPSTTLTMLTLLHHSGNEELGMTGCNQAIDIVLQHVNERKDILPNFHLTHQAVDEGVAARDANRKIIDFERSIEASKAPVILGPSRGCDVSGLTAKHLGYVSVSPQCHGSYIMKMKEKFNLPLFSMQQPLTIALHSLFYFIREIGHWNEIGLVTLRNNQNLLSDAEFTEKVATENGVKVLHYESEMTVSRQTLVNMKQADVRILVLIIGQPTLCLNIWCWAYQEGMRAPTHVFLFHIFNCISVNLDKVPIPQNCTREQIEEQIQVSFAVGNALDRVGNVENIDTPLGYNYEQFNKEFAIKSKMKKLTDPQFRYACHDSAVLGVLGMNATEAILNEKYSMSLTDFDDNRPFIRDLLSETMLNLQFTGLRIGNISYSPTTGQVSESNYAVQVLNGSLQYLYEINVETSQNGSIHYKNIHKFQEPVWYSKSGQPPKDLSNVISLVQMPGKVSIAIVTTVSLLASIFQSLLIYRSKKSVMISWKIQLACSLAFLNFTVILNNIGQIYFPIANCQLSFPITMFAFCIFLTFLAQHSLSFDLIAIPTSRCNRRMSFQKIRKTLTINLKKSSIYKILLIFLVNLILFVIFFTPLSKLEMATKISKPFYNEQSNSYLKIVANYCPFQNSLYLTSAILIFNLAITMVNAFKLYKISKTPRLQSNEHTNSFQLIRLATTNAILAIPSGCLIMAVASNVSYHIQILFLSAVVLLFSISSTFIMFKPF